MTNIKLILLLGFILAGAFYLTQDFWTRQAFEPTPSNLEEGVRPSETETEEDISIVAESLNIPWEIAHLPDGRILVTERPGTLRLIQDGTVITIEGVRHIGEGGLLGMALHPDFERNNFVYLYLTTTENGQTVNRVERYRLSGDQLTDRTVIISSIPAAVFHDGGRIEFSPDGYLYITTGDAGNGSLAQNTNSLAGKILRIKDDGSIPADNPFGNAVYSYGHRNPQGLAWDEAGRLWATEHGRSGLRSGFDEINLIEKGVNYGWPVIQGDEEREGMRRPVVHSGATETWAPCDVEFVGGKLFFTGLRGESVYAAVINGNSISALQRHFTGQWGRLRAVRRGPDGFIYITTSNRDGRGDVRSGDDKIIKINPDILNQ